MDKGKFPDRYKMKVFVDDSLIDIIKSKDIKYLLKKKNEIKLDYTTENISDGKGRGTKVNDCNNQEVTFKIVASNVIRIPKPRFVGFEDSDWVVYYGSNSQGEIYGSDKDYSKIKKLKESI